MKFYKFIKITLLIFVLSTNLMLGQKTETRTSTTKCFANQSEQSLENCPQDLLETGAFFRFAAL